MGKRFEKKNCRVCQKEFEAKRSDARYCSNNCRQKFVRGGAMKEKFELLPAFLKETPKEYFNGMIPMIQGGGTVPYSTDNTKIQDMGKYAHPVHLIYDAPELTDLTIDESAQFAITKSIQLPPDYVEVKNVSILKDSKEIARKIINPESPRTKQKIEIPFEKTIEGRIKAAEDTEKK